MFQLIIYILFILKRINQSNFFVYIIHIGKYNIFGRMFVIFLKCAMCYSIYVLNIYDSM